MIPHGNWAPVARDHAVLFKNTHPKPTPHSPITLPVPTSALAEASLEFVTQHLDPKTLNHSKRIYFLGLAIQLSTFPEWEVDRETWYLTCLFHDIGLADAYHLSTKMSFEFKGAIVAREFLLTHGATEDQADSVCEAIILHQDVWLKTGNISLNGQMIILATLCDNAGHHGDSVHTETIKAVCDAFPRNGWSEAFACAVEKEMREKPWSHTTTFETPNWRQQERGSSFGDTARANALMEPYDKEGA